MSKKLDVTGVKYGRLTGVKSTENRKWLWKCDCGSTKEINLTNVRMGYTRSCGCLNLERITIHGKSDHWLYSTYCGIKARCSNTTYKRFPDYGGRGIKCEFDTFECFYNYVSKLPNFKKVKKEKLSINRIDNDGNYAVGNLEWSSQRKQEANKRISKNNTSGVEGVSFCKRNKRWYAMLAIQGTNPYLGCFKTKEEAIEVRQKAESKYREGIAY